MTYNVFGVTLNLTQSNPDGPTSLYAPLLPVSREHSATFLFCLSLIFDNVCPSSPRFTLFSAHVDSSFQHFGAQISGCNHTTEILELVQLSA